LRRFRNLAYCCYNNQGIFTLGNQPFMRCALDVGADAVGGQGLV
jgi:hypothetical protein